MVDSPMPPNDVSVAAGLDRLCNAIERIATALETTRQIEPAKVEPPIEGMLTVKQTAAELGVCEWTVYMMAKSGRLPASRIGNGRGVLRFSTAAVEIYKREAAGNPLPMRVAARPVTPPRWRHAG